MTDQTQTPHDDEEARYLAAVSGDRPPDNPPPGDGNDEPNPNPPTEAGSSFQGQEKSPETEQVNFDELPEAVRKHIKKLDDERKAAIGQNAPIQRKVSELLQEIRHLKQQPPAPPAAPPSTPAPRQESQRPESTDSDYYESEEWKEFERDYPEVARLQRKLNDRYQTQADAIAQSRVKELESRFDQKLGKVDTFLQEQEFTRELSSLEKKHPDWRDHVIATQDDHMHIGTDEGGNPVFVKSNFGNWLLAQHPSVQQLYFSPRAEDNIYLMDLHKSTTQKAASPAPAQPARRKPDIDPSPRQRAIGVPQRGDVNDPEEAAYLAAIERAQLSR